MLQCTNSTVCLHWPNHNQCRCMQISHHGFLVCFLSSHQQDHIKLKRLMLIHLYILCSFNSCCAYSTTSNLLACELPSFASFPLKVKMWKLTQMESKYVTVTSLCDSVIITESRGYYVNRCNHVWPKRQGNFWNESETMQFIKILQSPINTGKIQIHIQKQKCRIPYFKWRKENIFHTSFTNVRSIVTFSSNMLTDLNTLLNKVI